MNLKFSHGDHSFAYGDMDAEDFGLHGEVVSWSDSFLVLARMCELGHGVAIMPAMLARDYEAVQPICPDRPDAQAELWMLSRFDLRAAWQRDLADMLQSDVAQWAA